MNTEIEEEVPTTTALKDASVVYVLMANGKADRVFNNSDLAWADLERYRSIFPRNGYYIQIAAFWGDGK